MQIFVSLELSSNSHRTTERFAPQDSLNLVCFSQILLLCLSKVVIYGSNICQKSFLSEIFAITERKSSVGKGNQISLHLSTHGSEKRNLLGQVDPGSMHILKQTLLLPQLLIFVFKAVATERQSILGYEFNRKVGDSGPIFFISDFTFVRYLDGP